MRSELVYRTSSVTLVVISESEIAEPQVIKEAGELTIMTSTLLSRTKKNDTDSSATVQMTMSDLDSDFYDFDWIMEEMTEHFHALKK